MIRKPNKSGLVAGKLVLLVMFASAALVPALVWLTLRWVQADLAIDHPPMSWAHRASWPSPPIKRTTLEQPRRSYGYHEPKGRWRDSGFQISDGAESDIGRCLAVAGLADPERDWIHSPNVRRGLEEVAADRPDLFYPPYLLGTWHRRARHEQEADPYYERAFALAPAVLKQRFVGTCGQPLARFKVGTIEIACDRVIDGELDQTLRLVYPDLVTDEQGWVYLPVYHTVLRLSVLPQLPGLAVQYGIDGWFEFSGRIGALKPAVITKLPTDVPAD